MKTTFVRVLAFCLLLCLCVASFAPFATRSAEFPNASFGNLAPNITATLTDSFPDPDGNGKASRGEEITYTATFTNNGTTAAINTSVDFPLDSNLTLVPNSTTVSRRTLPSVVSTTPANAAVNVSRTSPITVTFNRAVNATVNSFTLQCPSATPQAFSVGGSGTTTITLTPSQALPGNTNCQVKVLANEIRSTTFNDPMTADYTFGFTTMPISALLRITEVAPNITSSRDLVELLVVQGGNVSNMTLVQDRTTVLATLPNVDVATGDVIIIHLAPTISNGDAPGSETIGKNQYPAATYSSNYDTAWDFHGGATGITYSSRILRINGADGVTQDAAPFTRTVGTPPAAFPTELQALQAEGLWLPAKSQNANECGFHKLLC